MDSLADARSLLVNGMDWSRSWNWEKQRQAHLLLCDWQQVALIRCKDSRAFEERRGLVRMCTEWRGTRRLCQVHGDGNRCTPAYTTPPSMHAAAPCMHCCPWLAVHSSILLLFNFVCTYSQLQPPPKKEKKRNVVLYMVSRSLPTLGFQRRINTSCSLHWSLWCNSVSSD
jgi:hypothetical protein